MRSESLVRGKKYDLIPDGTPLEWSDSEEKRPQYLPVRIYRFVGFSTVLVSAAFEEERGDVGRADGRVDDKDENEPVPYGFERRVVQYRPAVMTRHMQLVLRQHVRSQRQHLYRYKVKVQPIVRRTVGAPGRC